MRVALDALCKMEYQRKLLGKHWGKEHPIGITTSSDVSTSQALVVFKWSGHSLSIISNPEIHANFINHYDDIWDQRFGEFSYLEYAWEMKHFSEDFGTRTLDKLCDSTDRYLVRPDLYRMSGDRREQNQDGEEKGKAKGKGKDYKKGKGKSKEEDQGANKKEKEGKEEERAKANKKEKEGKEEERAKAKEEEKEEERPKAKEEEKRVETKEKPHGKENTSSSTTRAPWT